MEDEDNEGSDSTENDNKYDDNDYNDGGTLVVCPPSTRKSLGMWGEIIGTSR